MTYEGIEFAIRAGLGPNEWVATIHFPDAANEPLARSSMVKVTGTRNRADAGAHSQLVETAETEGTRHHLYLMQINPHFLPQRELGMRGPIRGLSAAARQSGLRSTPRSDPTDFPA
jgi:hypothetical protein